MQPRTSLPKLRRTNVESIEENVTKRPCQFLKIRGCNGREHIREHISIERGSGRARRSSTPSSFAAVLRASMGGEWGKKGKGKWGDSKGKGGTWGKGSDKGKKGKDGKGKGKGDSYRRSLGLDPGFVDNMDDKFEKRGEKRSRQESDAIEHKFNIHLLRPGQTRTGYLFNFKPTTQPTMASTSTSSPDVMN